MFRATGSVNPSGDKGECESRDDIRGHFTSLLGTSVFRIFTTTPQSFLWDYLGEGRGTKEKTDLEFVINVLSWVTSTRKKETRT